MDPASTWMARLKTQCKLLHEDENKLKMEPPTGVTDALIPFNKYIQERS